MMRCGHLYAQGKILHFLLFLIFSRLSQILETNSPSDLFRNFEDPIIVDLEEVPRKSPESESGHSRQNSLTRSNRMIDDTPRHIKVIKGNSLPIIPILKKQGKSTVRLGLIETLNEIAFTHYSSLATHHLVILLDSLQNCYQYSLIVHQNALLVTKIAKTGLQKSFLFFDFFFRVVGFVTKN
jgi:hypothetical protein